MDVTQHPLISVIVPVYNGEKFLPACLDALRASDYPAFEVIVVDDGSTDRSAEIARSRGAVVMTTARRQSGPAAARNLAAGKVSGAILVFVDADVVVARETLSRIAAAFAARPEYGALFGSYDDAPGEPNFLSQYRNLLHHYVHQTANPEASTFWAGLGAVRREAFLAVSGFDCEKFAVPSIEDIEFGVRLRAAGQRILLARDIQAKHLKKWTPYSVVMTDVFCRALPWSRLMLTSEGVINDMNTKTSDRLSAGCVGLALAALPLAVWKPWLVALPVVLLAAVLWLNRRLFRFFARKKGFLFAAAALPWQLLFFFYSGTTFVLCWFRYALPLRLGFRETKEINGTGIIN